MVIGLSDLFGRRIVNGTAVITAAFVMQGVAALTAGGALIFLGGSLELEASIRAALSGFGIAVGLGGYYAGVSRSTSAVVAPITATLSAVIPFGYAAIQSTSPTALAWLGAVIAFGGLLMVSGEGLFGAESISRDVVRVGSVWGLISGLGYGVGLAALVGISESSGAWSSVIQRIVATLALVGAAIFTRTSLQVPKAVRFDGVMSGTMGGVTTVLAIMAIQASPTIGVVTISMFPAFTIIVGRTFFADSISRLQAAGLFASLLGVTLVVAG